MKSGADPDLNAKRKIDRLSQKIARTCGFGDLQICYSAPTLRTLPFYMALPDI